jgi:crotonobetainyl-CoA:carnitine CoA-transferase CaiB-like acyl-CoA transferase
LRVVDLSSLWAGPLCGAVLAGLGAAVTKVESRRRPDPGRSSTPEFFRRLNGAKAELALDFAQAADRERLRRMVLEADVVITSARPRAFDALGLAPAGIFAERPDLVWAAISGYGFTGDQADRVAFGDDAAAAGGLVSWTARGAPRFLGDALADTLTGLAAAAGVLRALRAGGGALVDAALARTAAGAAAEIAARASRPAQGAA